MRLSGARSFSRSASLLVRSYARVLEKEADSVHLSDLLSLDSPSGEDRWRNLFRQRGYIEGHKAVFEFRWAGERFEKLPALADELVRLRVDVIMTAGIE
jgi:hypothetical protein